MRCDQLTPNEHRAKDNLKSVEEIVAHNNHLRPTRCPTFTRGYRLNARRGHRKWWIETCKWVEKEEGGTVALFLCCHLIVPLANEREGHFIVISVWIGIESVALLFRLLYYFSWVADWLQGVNPQQGSLKCIESETKLFSFNWYHSRTLICVFFSCFGIVKSEVALDGGGKCKSMSSGACLGPLKYERRGM